MNPSGQRGFHSPADAKIAARGARAVSYVILQHGQEFAWVGPVEFFMSRCAAAISRGIGIVEWGES